MRVIRAGAAVSAIGGIAAGALIPSLTVVAAAQGNAITAETALLTGTALIMGGTTDPEPAPGYVADINNHYLAVNPDFADYSPQGLTTPEQLWPVFGDMTFDRSVAAGVADLDTAIRQQLGDGNAALVSGYSQSATIASIEMQRLVAEPPPNADDLAFMMIADPNNPNGGLFERFVGLRIPLIDMTASGATPVDAFPTEIYSAEYDGFADFPRYPLNTLSVINALAGIATVHATYPDFTADQVGSALHIGHAGLTDFYMIPTPELPILWPLYQLGDFGKVMADAIQPTLKVIIDLGYGNPANGWSLDPGVAAPIGFLPKLDPLAVLAALQLAEVHGIVSPINDLLGYAGLPPLSQDAIDVLTAASGYTITDELDQALRSALTELSASPGLADLNPDVLFDGTPLIDGTPLLEAMQTVLGFFGE